MWFVDCSCKQNCYLACRGQNSGPLFQFQNGTFLTRQKFVHYVHYVHSALEETGVNPTKYNKHSFRIGAATMAVAKEMEDSLIKFFWEDGRVQDTSGIFGSPGYYLPPTPLPLQHDLWLTCNSLHVTLHLSSFCVPVYVPSEGTSCNSWHHYQPLPCKSYSPELGGGNLWLLLGQGWRLETLHS